MSNYLNSETLQEAYANLLTSCGQRPLKPPTGTQQSYVFDLSVPDFPFSTSQMGQVFLLVFQSIQDFDIPHLDIWPTERVNKTSRHPQSSLQELWVWAGAWKCCASQGLNYHTEKAHNTKRNLTTSSGEPQAVGCGEGLNHLTKVWVAVCQAGALGLWARAFAWKEFIPILCLDERLDTRQEHHHDGSQPGSFRNQKKSEEHLCICPFKSHFWIILKTI